jgi:uncharacterized protein (TIGR02452 family)
MSFAVACFGIKAASKGSPSVPIDEELINSALDKSTRHTVVRRIWNSATFRQCAQTALAARDIRLVKAQRQLVQVGTLDALLRARYFLENGEHVDFDKARLLAAMRSTEKIRPLTNENDIVIESQSSSSSSSSSSSPASVFIGVMHGDCIDAAIVLRQALGKRTAVLNMANESNPGGGWQSGSGAQEENLCRRTGLIFCIADPFHWLDEPRELYPIDEFAVVHSKNVPVFRGSEADGYPFLPTVFWLGFLTAPAYRHPPTQPDADGRDMMSGKWRVKIRSKARALLQCAALKGERALVLSAWGCGAFSNPPHEIAHAFHDVINEAEFVGRFDAIVFAILEDHNSQRGGNLPPFSERFETPILQGPIELDQKLRERFNSSAAVAGEIESPDGALDPGALDPSSSPTSE